jgi:hypothetical protein
MTTMRAMGLTLAVAVTAACAGTPSQGVPSPRAPDRPRISIINDSPQDVRVFVEPSGYPLGRITAFATKDFDLPRAMSTLVIRLRIQPFATSRSFTTSEVTLDTERRFELRVTRRLSASQVVVR